MSKRASKVQATTLQPEQQPVQTPTTPQAEVQPQVYSKSDYIKAKAIIASYKQQQKDRPKRTCTEKQLAALAQGRAKNPRTKKQDTQQ